MAAAQPSRMKNTPLKKKVSQKFLTPQPKKATSNTSPRKRNKLLQSEGKVSNGNSSGGVRQVSGAVDSTWEVESGMSERKGVEERINRAQDENEKGVDGLPEDQNNDVNKGDEPVKADAEDHDADASGNGGGGEEAEGNDDENEGKREERPDEEGEVVAKGDTEELRSDRAKKEKTNDNVNTNHAEGDRPSKTAEIEDAEGESRQGDEDEDKGVQDGTGDRVQGGQLRAADEKSAKKKALGKKKLKVMEEKQRKRGVCYISRLPPHMKPLKLRHLLEPYGEILRIYLAPEDPANRMRRKRAGGDRGKKFTEGWVEFGSKKVAKRVAALLNGEPMESKKRSAYHYDLWTIKYLHKFKWDNLTEEIAYRNAVREQKLAAELSQATKERDFYLSRVDQSRAIKAMAERKRKRGGGGDHEGVQKTGNEVDGTADGGLDSKGNKKVVRRFAQREVLHDPANLGGPRLSASVLKKVWGGTAKDGLPRD